jgi:hypothetical protein
VESLLSRNVQLCGRSENPAIRWMTVRGRQEVAWKWVQMKEAQATAIWQGSHAAHRLFSSS